LIAADAPGAKADLAYFGFGGTEFSVMHDGVR
jgi:hypothetical protein